MLELFLHIAKLSTGVSLTPFWMFVMLIVEVYKIHQERISFLKI